ncbi:hypothetical protein A4X03_0g9440, partial [Tilletia caries]
MRAPRCRRGCLDPKDPRMCRLLPCEPGAHSKPSKDGEPARSPDAVTTSSSSAPAQGPDTRVPAPRVLAADAVINDQHGTAAEAMVEANALLAAAEAARLHDLESASASPASPLPPFLDPTLLAASRRANEHESGGLQIRTRRDSDTETDSEHAMTAGTTEIPTNAKGKKRQRVNVNLRPEPNLTEAQYRDIWLNLKNSHNYAMKYYEYEHNSQARMQVAKRGTWRLIEQGAKLSARSGLAVFIAFGPLNESAKAEARDHVYVSPNLCDGARPTLRAMAEHAANDFKTTMHMYREAARANTAQALEANKVLIAEKTALKEKNDELEAL